MMAISADEIPTGPIARALIDFSTEGTFPDEHVSSLQLMPDVLPPVIDELAAAKAETKVPVGFSGRTRRRAKRW